MDAAEQQPTLHVAVAGPVATLTLARAEARNALDGGLTGTLTQAFQKLGVADAVRVIVLAAQPPCFCIGADLAASQRSAAAPMAENQRDAMQQAVLLDAIDRCPKPVIAVVDGLAQGIGAGLVAACDMAIASEQARFALPEVRLGLPASISAPYLASAIGLRACRRYLLTGERMDAHEALRLGLVHAVVAQDRLEDARNTLVRACLKGGPKAQAASKDMLRVLAETAAGPDRMRYAATHFADARADAEAKEGLAALGEKRPPAWQ